MTASLNLRRSLTPIFALALVLCAAAAVAVGTRGWPAPDERPPAVVVDDTLPDVGHVEASAETIAPSFVLVWTGSDAGTIANVFETFDDMERELRAAAEHGADDPLQLVGAWHLDEPIKARFDGERWYLSP